MTARARKLLHRMEWGLLPICPREQRDTLPPRTALPPASPVSCLYSAEASSALRFVRFSKFH